MKETIISTSEKTFISEYIRNYQQRLDGRTLDEFRPIKINFGKDWGCVHVQLGETSVLAQTTCEAVQPKPTRPNEGLLFLRCEIGSMAAPHFECGKRTELLVHVNRILEKAFKESRCIDLESLCIISDEKVWNLRVDLNVLNHEGNIIDCASIAVLASLAHFKRPDVLTTGEDFQILTSAQSDYIPISLHHYPVCVSYTLLNNGEIAIADPTAIEERITDAKIIFGLNSYRELCGLHFSGLALGDLQILIKLSAKAARRALNVVNIVKEAVKNDGNKRSENCPIGLAHNFKETINVTKEMITLPIKLKEFSLSKCTDEIVVKSEPNQIVKGKSDLAILLPVEENIKNEDDSKWLPDDNSFDSDSSRMDDDES